MTSKNMENAYSKKQAGQVGGIIGIAIVIIVLVIGAFYFYKYKIEPRLNPVNNQQPSELNSTTTINVPIR